MSSASPIARGALAGFWRELSAAIRTPEDQPLAARLATAAMHWTGARCAVVYVREEDGWVRGADFGEDAHSLALPEPCPDQPGFAGEALWIPLVAEAEIYGMLGLGGIPREEADEIGAFLGFVLGSHLAAHRLSRLVKEAEFEVKTRLLELESLYDLGLSLGGQLDLAALADEVLFRSISLTDSGKGILVLFDDGGRTLYERSIGGELLARDRFSSWRIPEGEALVNNEASALPTAGERLSDCEKCLAVAISVPGRRLGFLAVADKESREGGVLDFTATDARLLSLFANQAAAAIETARLHQDALEKERIERELELAAAIQREILPRFLPSVAGVELAAANVPARHIGGDYYDVFPLSRGRIAFLVADVSGKGVPAALLVSTVHAAVHLQIDEAPTIVDLVTRIDRHLRRFAATRKFLTLFFGLLEPDTGALQYVSAGHNPALLVRSSGETETLESTGVPVGMLPNAKWTEGTRAMSPGDLLCVYSDGITEAGNAAEEEYGMERLTTELTARRELPVQRIADELLASVADFARGVPQYDDQTLLFVRRV